ncbi:hypothetical protein M3650_30625 [Paenibacillus sp. MER TA 81-3]|uniref:hypothetical protein n=1 Tax=Paenibacillus sp. MER TA 81-3 TaxID=2939573 RepID=UPI002041CFCF|nr:hypothetical protein [Paenibacillus sp. MER TA 81-3]MCM3342864.1 hypothetical protein [Paenibacillus sp. MER TA 81-3]
MNVKKAILATMIVSSMFVTLAGPIPAGAEAAQEQKQTDNKKVQIDKKIAAKLEKAVSEFAGKEIKLKLQDAFKHPHGIVAVESVDGDYSIDFKPETGDIINITGNQSINKVSKKDQDDLLNKLKAMYGKKTYTFHKEVQVTQSYENNKESRTFYLLKGKDFTISLMKYAPGTKDKNYIGAAVIEFDKNELDPKLLKTAAEAVKTALDQDFDVTKAKLGYYQGMKETMWELKGGNVTLAVEAKTGNTEYVYDISRKRVMTNKEITEKEVKEIVAPIAKKLFQMDIQGLEVQWDNSAKDFCFVQNKDTKMTVALDADKNVVYMFSGIRMLLEN